MIAKRQKIFLTIFSAGTAMNILLVLHIHSTGNIRDNWENNYVLPFSILDIGLFVALFSVIFIAGRFFGDRIVPRMRDCLAQPSNEKTRKFFVGKHSIIRVFVFIFTIWLFFFLVMYPGTAMNDTIYILENPWKLSSQHPLFYNLYIYGLFKLGNWWENPNVGLAMISLVQMVALAYVLAEAIVLLSEKLVVYGKTMKISIMLTLYFSIAPLFSTYAVSAIKDTPFSICMFYLTVLLCQLSESNGEIILKIGYKIKVLVCVMGIVGFRSNGLIVTLGTVFVLIFIYKKHLKQLVGIWFIAIGAVLIFNVAFKPIEGERLLQESVGMQIQQVGAVASKGLLAQEQEEYLYKLLPKEKWENYAPSCADVLKWDSEFDREYLNDTGRDFLSIWWDLLQKYPKEYFHAYLMNTYGMWGIGTRDKEQYYQKDIWENNLGIYQDSPLPDALWELVYHVYCNRFTYRYLSAGTAFWLLGAVILWLIYRRMYKVACIFTPTMCCFLTLLLATPIAFAFRYVFVIALLFPFYMIMPFLIENTEEKDYLDESRRKQMENT